jgi:hypothetical protein|tara:strand:- start:503 stop:655 length:153 start_codon:yes stop_codon:yes gene_type:complete
MSVQLATEQVKTFYRPAFVIVAGFRDLATEVELVQRHIHLPIGLAMKKKF